MKASLNASQGKSALPFLPHRLQLWVKCDEAALCMKEANLKEKKQGKCKEKEEQSETDGVRALLRMSIPITHQ